MSVKITNAMVLAAGRGTRMRSLTDETPKPLIKVSGKTLIDHVLDKIVAQGIKECVVNVCYLGDKIKDNLNKRTDLHFIFSEEEEALETGGGVKKALPLLGDKPFFVLNADPLWTEESAPCLERMAADFNPETMDILFLLWPIERVFGHDGKGDYYIENGKPRRKRRDEATAPYVYAGAQILNPDLFKDSPEGKFSLNLLYDQAEKAGRLAATLGDGDWYHVGTPEALKLAEENIKG